MTSYKSAWLEDAAVSSSTNNVTSSNLQAQANSVLDQIKNSEQLSAINQTNVKSENPVSNSSQTSQNILNKTDVNAPLNAVNVPIINTKTDENSTKATSSISMSNQKPNIQSTTTDYTPSVSGSKSNVVSASHIISESDFKMPRRIHWGTIIFGILAVIVVSGLLATVVMFTNSTKQIANNIKDQSNEIAQVLEEELVIPEVEASYQNPLDEKSTYQNPFETDSNPFDDISE